MTFRILTILLLFMTVGLGSASAQNREVPYWASIKPDELNMRVGPSTDFKIVWVFRRAGLPIKVIRVQEGWRMIEDVDGEKGWVLASFLNPRRSALVVGDGLAPMRELPASSAKLKWNLEPGVVGYLSDCEAGWCNLNVHGHKGWVEQTRLWGSGTP